jgi:cytidylate kinase
MPIVLISNFPHGSGRELALKLAEKTNWPIYSREQLAEKAISNGVKLSRLETSIIKSPVINEKLAREKDQYLALVTKTICETASDGNLIYYGRAGHFLLPGIPGILRVGLQTTMEMRIENAMDQLNLPREKATDYLQKLDEDVEKWTHYIHRESSHNPAAYDLFLNQQQMSLENAAAILFETAMLPAFRLTTESRKMLDDRCLAASARILLARDPVTKGMDLGVHAKNGVVTVTYMPRQEMFAENISQVLQNLKGCRETICTMAETNILWIQETFDPKGENFPQVMSLAQRWGAAVELLCLDSEGKYTPQIPVMENLEAVEPSTQAYTGGVEDDDKESLYDDKGLAKTEEELVAVGRYAGGRTVAGGSREVIDMVKDHNYSLVIIGDLFLSKGHETSTRLTRELGLIINEKLKAPVINTAELQSRFLFGKKQMLRLVFFLLATVLIFGFVFTFQEPILNILGGEFHSRFKWVASLVIVLFVPLVAYIYSMVTGLALKIIGID